MPSVIPALILVFLTTAIYFARLPPMLNRVVAAAAVGGVAVALYAATAPRNEEGYREPWSIALIGLLGLLGVAILIWRKILPLSIRLEPFYSKSSQYIVVRNLGTQREFTAYCRIIAIANDSKPHPTRSRFNLAWVGSDGPKQSISKGDEARLLLADHTVDPRIHHRGEIRLKQFGTSEPTWSADWVLEQQEPWHKLPRCRFEIELASDSWWGSFKKRGTISPERYSGGLRLELE